MKELEEAPWEDEGDRDEEDFSFATCPECGHVFFFDPGAYEEGESLECPACGFCMAGPEDMVEHP